MLTEKEVRKEAENARNTLGSMAPRINRDYFLGMLDAYRRVLKCEGYILDPIDEKQGRLK